MACKIKKRLKRRMTGGGEGGIRTHGGFAPTPDFESGTFDHSATSPGCNRWEQLRVRLVADSSDAKAPLGSRA